MSVTIGIFTYFPWAKCNKVMRAVVWLVWFRAFRGRLISGIKKSVGVIQDILVALAGMLALVREQISLTKLINFKSTGADYRR